MRHLVGLVGVVRESTSSVSHLGVPKAGIYSQVERCTSVVMMRSLELGYAISIESVVGAVASATER